MCKKVVNCFTMVKSNVNPFFTMVKVYQFFPVRGGRLYFTTLTNIYVIDSDTMTQLSTLSVQRFTTGMAVPRDDRPPIMVYTYIPLMVHLLAQFALRGIWFGTVLFRLLIHLNGYRQIKMR